MTQSGQGGEPQSPSGRPAYEGIVLPADGSGPWIPGTPEEPEATPVGGAPWGGSWGPEEPPAPAPAAYGYPNPYPEQQAYQAYPEYQDPYAQPGYQDPYPYQGQDQGQDPYAYQGEAGYPYADPAAAATQYIPPVPADPAAAATQYIPPVPADPAAAATQYIPPVPADPDAAATQYIPPVPAEPGPPAEFDGLFRTSGGGTGGYGYPNDAPGSTAQLPKIEEPVAPRRPQPQPQYHQAPPPPPPHPYDHEPEGRRAPVGLIAAGVLGLAVVGLGVGALMGNGSHKSNDPTSTLSDNAKPPASAEAEKPVDPARAQAVQLDKLLEDSGGSRDAVIAAVANIKKCDDLSQAGEDLHDAARQREELVTRLDELKIDQLPDHDRLASALTKAWKYSASADKHYAEWADQVDGGKKYCKNGKARNTSHAAAGNKASGQATQYKEQASVLWNRIAAKYDLTKRDRTKL